METSKVSKTPIEDAWNMYAPILEGVPPVYVAQLKSMFEAGAVAVCAQLIQMDRLPDGDPRAMMQALFEEGADIVRRTVSEEAVKVREAIAAAIAAAVVAEAKADGKAGTN